MPWEGDVVAGDSGSPYVAQDLAPGLPPESVASRFWMVFPCARWTSRRPGPHLDQNVLGQLRRRSPGLDSGPLGWPLFPPPAWPGQRPLPIWRKLGTRKSRLETKSENEARSALLARLWCHLILQNPANRAETRICLCSATIGQTGWRMVQVGAIRSRQKVVQLLAEILKQKSQWRFRRFRVSHIY